MIVKSFLMLLSFAIFVVAAGILLFALKIFLESMDYISNPDNLLLLMSIVVFAVGFVILFAAIAVFRSSRKK